MSAHTPGPWTVGQSGDDYVVAGQWAGVKTGRRVMSIRTGVIPSPDDAHLIAAAPELLEELARLYEAARCMADPEHSLHEYREHLPWKDLASQARVAIAKAKGESQ